MRTFDPSLRRSLRELTHAILDLVLPPHCPGCGERLMERTGNGRLCRACAIDLEPLPAIGCWRCGEPAANGLGERDAGETVRCSGDHRALTGFAFARAAFAYRGSGGALVRRLKLGGDFGALDALATAMAQRVAPRLLGEWRRPVFVAVPLHRSRRKARGFDQAQLLAEAVAHRVGAPSERGVLVRVRSTLPQGDARVLSRAHNVEGAFVVAQQRRIEGRNVALVDDVMTSGATARACAEVLRAAGANAVALVTACRARSLLA
jgi:ComF family protein